MIVIVNDSQFNLSMTFYDFEWLWMTLRFLSHRGRISDLFKPSPSCQRFPQLRQVVRISTGSFYVKWQMQAFGIRPTHVRFQDTAIPTPFSSFHSTIGLVLREHSREIRIFLRYKNHGFRGKVWFMAGGQSFTALNSRSASACLSCLCSGYATSFRVIPSPS